MFIKLNALHVGVNLYRAYRIYEKLLHYQFNWNRCVLKIMWNGVKNGMRGRACKKQQANISTHVRKDSQKKMNLWWTGFFPAPLNKIHWLSSFHILLNDFFPSFSLLHSVSCCYYCYFQTLGALFTFTIGRFDWTTINTREMWIAKKSIKIKESTLSGTTLDILYKTNWSANTPWNLMCTSNCEFVIDGSTLSPDSEL